MTIIARSRIGYWTAFSSSDGSFLNVRDDEGRSVTALLTPDDVALLSADAGVCHPHARLLAKRGPFVVPSLPTPPRSNDEPEPHEWEPRKEASLARVVELKAA